MRIFDREIRRLQSDKLFYQYMHDDILVTIKSLEEKLNNVKSLIEENNLHIKHLDFEVK